MQKRIKKDKIGISISPNLIREAEEIMDEVGIPTISDFISQAVIVYIDRYKREQKEKAVVLKESLSSSKNEQPVTINHIQE